MKVVEKFISINGEGRRAGELAVFIRFKGCNLRCSYCDTMWANEKDCPYKEESVEEIYEYIQASGVKNVTLTGGEPLLQEGIEELLEVLSKDPGLRVEIETNGAVDLTSLVNGQNPPSFTMDYKLPSSGWEHSMIHDNFALLGSRDTVKFVCGSQEDLRRALEIMDTYDLRRKCQVYFSPVFGQIEPVEIVGFMMNHHLNDARIQIQMHKIIWDPEKRGV